MNSQAIELADVTGDGVLDVVVAATFADVGGVVNAGAIYVWKGGATLTGTPAPFATLDDSGAVANDQLATVRRPGGAARRRDRRRHPRRDRRRASSRTSRGILDAGAIYVWKGGVVA